MQKKIICLIKEFSKRGFGIGYFPHSQTKEPTPVEVAHTVIGDEVEVALYSKRKRYRKGRLLQITKPSSKREKPRCKHVGICGGCAWQQMKYVQQIEQKQQTVQKIFGSYLGLKILPMIVCDNPWHYRNKMEFSFSENKAGEKFLGLMIAHASTYVFNVVECHLVNSWMAKILNKVRLWWQDSGLSAYHLHENAGHLRTITLRESFHTKEKMIMLTVSGDPNFALKKAQIESFVQVITQELAEENPSIFLQIQQAKKGHRTQFFEMHLSGPLYLTEKMSLLTHELYFKISPTSFFQPNSVQAENLYQKALELASIKEGEIVFDLYAGTGTLGMAFSKKAKKVIAIELNAHAVCDGEENLRLNQIDNMEILQGDVGKILSEQALPKPDLVIVDPPRVGLDDAALFSIKNLSPRKILYISCNPLTQEKNCRYLIEHGYRLKILQPIDQFPHTYHIENIALLKLET